MLKKFKRFTKLRVLDVEGCFQITDSGMASLEGNIEGMREVFCEYPIYFCVHAHLLFVAVLNIAQCIGVFRKGEARAGAMFLRFALEGHLSCVFF